MFVNQLIITDIFGCKYENFSIISQKDSFYLNV